MAADPPPGTDESALVELLARALDLRDRGTQVDPAALCAGRQDLVDRLRDGLAAHDRLGTAVVTADTRGQASDPMLGRVVGGRYEVVRRVGMGAMGSVFAARDRTLQRYVALKIVEPWVLDDDERRARFQREAQAIAALRHPGIVAVHDHGDGELPFLAMDLVPGLDLEAVLDRGLEGAEVGGRGAAILAAFARAGRREANAAPPVFTADELAPDEHAWRAPWPVLAARIAQAVAQALAHAHGHQVLHRDVKPSNVRLRPDGGVVLLDFGLARLPGTGSLTREGTLLGTLAYMAPEQVRGDRAGTSASADVYGLGATLYRLLTGRPPFLGEPAALMKQILDNDAVPVRRLAPDVPRDLAAICHKAIEKRPADRYASAVAMAADLAAFLEYRPVRAAPPSWPGRAWRKVRRHPARAAAVALVGIALPLAVFAKQGRDARAFERTRARAHEARQGVPALVTLEGRNPAMSLVAWRLPSPDPQGTALARLGHVLAADPDDVEALSLRAMLHLDCGLGSAGIADLRRLLATHPRSTILSRVLERLSTGAPWTTDDWRADLVADQPAPASAFDAFLSGYLQMRAVRYREGLADVQRALALDAEFVPALHLLPLALLGVGERTAAMDAAILVEGVIGRPTARTRYVVARERQERGRVGEAVAALEQSLALCPDQHGPLQNLAACLLDLGEFEKAADRVTQALAVRPDAVATLRSQIQVLDLLEQKEQLAGFVARVIAADGRPWWLELELGEIALKDAIRHTSAGRDAERRRLAGEAVEQLSAALPSLPPAGADRAKVETRLAIAHCLREDKVEEAASNLLFALGFGRQEPITVGEAAALCDACGNHDSALYLLSTAHTSSPEDPHIGRYLIGRLLRRGDAASLLQAATVWRACFRTRQGPVTEQLREQILRGAADLAESDTLARCRDLLAVQHPNNQAPGAAERAVDPRASTATSPTQAR